MAQRWEEAYSTGIRPFQVTSFDARSQQLDMIPEVTFDPRQRFQSMNYESGNRLWKNCILATRHFGRMPGKTS